MKIKDIQEYLEIIESKIQTCINEPVNVPQHESCWSIYRLCHLRSKYVLEQLDAGKITKKHFKWLCKKGLADAVLIREWRKKGNGNLCCLRCIDKVSKTGNVCLCRVPTKFIINSEDIGKPCYNCGCRGCS